MNDAKRKRSKGLMARPLAARLERYAGRGGIVAFIEDAGAPPAAAPVAAPAAAAPAAAAPAEPSAAPAPAAAAPAATPAPSPAPVAAPAATPAPSPAPAPAAETGAPEAYADFTLPEGVAPDPALMGEFKTIAKELNLPQAAAQKLVDLNARVEVARAEQVQATLQQWETTAKADKEYGGDKFDENMALVAKAREQFVTPEFAQWLDQSKLGSHPEMIRAFFRIGQAISQDGFVPGRGGSAAAKDARSLYSASNMNP